MNCIGWSKGLEVTSAGQQLPLRRASVTRRGSRTHKAIAPLVDGDRAGLWVGSGWALGVSESWFHKWYDRPPTP